VTQWADTDALIATAEAAEAPHGRPVAVHVTAAATLDLAGHRKSHTPGNFRFISMPFGTFLRRLYGRPSRGALPCVASVWPGSKGIQTGGVSHLREGVA
jgi:hypothetical protein